MSPTRLEQTIHLVDRAQAKDETAITELFERYLPRVRRIAALRLGKTSHQLLCIDDVTQEVMTDAFCNLASFEHQSEGRFCDWLARIVENRIRMALRAGRAQKRGAGHEQRFSDARTTLHPSQFRGKEPTPSAHAIGAESRDRLEDGLLKISESARELIVSRLICKLEYDEIAEQLGISTVGAARAAFSRALKELEKHVV